MPKHYSVLFKTQAVGASQEALATSRDRLKAEY